MDGSTFWGIEAEKTGCGYYFNEHYENAVTNSATEGASFTIGFQRSFSEADI